MQSNKKKSEIIGSLTNITPLVKTVYQTTWVDFYTWEQDHCRRALHSLARSLPQGSSQDETLESVTLESNLPVQTSTRESTLGVNAETFTVLDIEDGISKASTLTVESYNIVPELEPCPAYEICTPASRNINVGDDSEYMPFIPLMDDPKFSYDAHIAEHRYFEWQVPNRDPDLEVIVMQTVYKLHVGYKMSLLSIDESGVLPLSILANPGGVLHTSRRRDFPAWGTLSSQSSSFPYLSSHGDAGPNANLSSLIRDFCNNYNCAIGYCTVHMGEMSIPEPAPPTVLSDALAHTVDTPCNTECFLLGNPPSIGTFWTPADLETLYSVLHYAPDTSPCDLAVICHKPCQEVFKHRRHAIPDVEVVKQSERTSRARPIRTSALQYRDHDAASFTPNWPCSHPGACDSRSKCPCFLNDAHCENGCRCDRKCARRWRGCNCARNRYGKICEVLPCAGYLCTTCSNEVELDAEAGICKNAEIQRDQNKLTAVRMSQWGLGLFLAEPAEEEDLIIEYTGELIYEPTTICRDYVSKHRGRTYLFQLNPTLSIDSSKAGNESRFINHSKKANCHACVRLVNGEHRIGLFALKRMKPGVEILLDYGDSFFEREASDDEADKADKAKQKKDVSLDQVVYVLDQHSSDETYSE